MGVEAHPEQRVTDAAVPTRSMLADVLLRFLVLAAPVPPVKVLLMGMLSLCSLLRLFVENF